MSDADFFKNILNSMRDLILVKGPRSKIVWANKAFLNYYGMTEEELTGIIDSPQSDPDNTLQYIIDDQQVFREKKDLNIPCEPVANHKGDVSYFHTIKSPMFTDNIMQHSVGVSRQLEDQNISQQHIKDEESKNYTAPLRSIIEHLPISASLLDNHLRIVKCNSHWSQNFGLVSEGPNHFFLESYRDFAGISNDLQTALKENQEIESTIKTIKNAQEVYYSCKISPWLYPSKEIGGVLVIANDITNLKLKEIQLKKTQKKLESLNRRLTLALEASQVGVWEWDLVNHDLTWDKQMLALYGIKEKDFSGAYSTWENGLHPEDKAKAIEDLNLALKENKKFDSEFRVCHPNGTIRSIKALADIVADAQNTPIKIIGVNWDITESKNYQQKLKDSNLRYQLMAEGASVGIWDWFDVHKNEEYWSPKFYELLGYKPGEISASLENFSTFLHPDDVNRTFELVDRHFEGEADFDLEYRLKTKSGDYRWFRGSGKVSRDESGKPKRMVGCIQDIHKSVVYKKELMRSNEELDQFAYIASHDLREPLRGMRNYSDFLLEDFAESLDQEAVGYLKTIKKLGKRLEKYLDSLLYYSRFGREKMAYKFTDIGKLAFEIFDSFDFKNENIDFQIDDSIPQIYCDPLTLQKIFTNLIQNAIRYNLKEKKSISIRHKILDDSMHLFMVIDNGIGIKKAHWERIFTIFKRLHGKDEFEGGTGVGLTLVKKAVERHGGEIWIEHSDVGKGTAIAFTIKERKP